MKNQYRFITHSKWFMVMGLVGLLMGLLFSPPNHSSWSALTSSVALAAPPLQATENMTITKQVNLAVANQRPVPPGDVLIYQITLQNGPVTYQGPLTLTDIVPSGASCFDTRTNSVKWNHNTAKCRQGLAEYTMLAQDKLLPNEIIVMQFSALPNSTEGAILTNLGSNITLFGPNLPVNVNGSNDVQTTVHAPTWQINKSVNVTTAAPGDTLTYQITARNIGTIETNGSFNIVEQLPANLNFISATNGGVFNATTRQISWTLNQTVAAGQNITVSFNAQVSPTAFNGDSITNPTYWVEGGYAAGQTFGLPAATVTVVTPVSVSLSKTVDVTTARAGQTLTYLLHVTNSATSPGPALNLVITDTLPNNTTFVSTDCLNITCDVFATGPTPSGDFTVGWRISQPIIPGGVVQIRLRVQINSPMPNGTIISNARYGVTSNFPLFISPATVPAINTTVVGPAAISLSKRANVILAHANDLIRFTISLTNSSSEPATNVRITENVPANSTFSGLPTGWSCNGTTCSYTLGTLAGNSSTFVDFEVRVNSLLFPPVNPIVNTAVIDYNSANGVPPNLSQNSASSAPIQVDVPGVLIGPKLQQKVGLPGQTLVYTLIVTNTGNSPDNIVIAVTADKFPLTSAFSQTFTLTLGSFATRTLQFQVRIPLTATLDVSDTVGILAQSSNNPNVSDIATFVTTAAQASDMELAKLLPKLSAQRGETITYTLIYNNLGSTAATNVQVMETLPAFVTFAGGTTGWQLVSNQYVFNLGTILPNFSGALDFAVTIDPNTPANITQIVNTASITSSSLDLNPNNNSNTRTILLVGSTPITGAARLTLSKIQQNSRPPRPGETITYSLIYANVGTDTAHSVVITETLPANTTFINNPTGWQAVGGNQYRYQLGDILPNQTTTPVIFAVRLNDSLSPANTAQVDNVAIIADMARASVATATLTTDINNPNAAQLTLDKSDGGVTTQAGSPIVYTLDYANNGSSSASAVTMQEIVPLNTTFIASASSVGWDCPNGSSEGVICRYSLGTVTAGNSHRLLFAVRVNGNLASSVMSIGNIATLEDGAGTKIADVEDTPLGNLPTVAKYIYLPIVLKNPPPPELDLQVSDVTVSNFAPQTGQAVNLYVTIRNNGTRAINTPFWVDLYLATSPINPTVNQSWDEAFNDSQVPYGVVWKVAELSAGGSRKLSNLVPNDPFDLKNNYSNFIPSGLGHWSQTWKGIPLSNSFRQPGRYYLYVLVDSLGGTTGAINEGNEANNLYGPVIFDVSGSALRFMPREVELQPLKLNETRPAVQP